MEAGSVFMIAISEIIGRRLCRKHNGAPSAKQSHSCVTGSVDERASAGADRVK